MKSWDQKHLANIQSLFEEKTNATLPESTMAADARPVMRRKPRLIAAVLVLILASLMGVAAIAGNRKEPSSSHPLPWGDEVFGATDENGFSVSGNLYTFYVDLPLDDNAPLEIEEHYLPQVPEGYSVFFGVLHGRDRIPSIGWKTQDDKSITFEQIVDVTYSDDGIPDRAVRYPVSILTDGEEPTVTKVTYGGREGFFIPEPKEGRSYFFWSDGRYAYRLEVPIDFTDEQLHELVSSVSRVEDIRPYLIDMTEEKIEEVLGKK